MAESRGRRRRQRFPRRHIEKFRQQFRTRSRQAARRGSRRVRPLVPPTVAGRGGHHLRRRRPPRHLRHARRAAPHLRPLRRTDKTGRDTHHQTGRRAPDSEPGHPHLHVYLRRGGRLPRDRTGGTARRHLSFRHRLPRPHHPRLPAGYPRPGECGERRGRRGPAVGGRFR